MCLPRETYRIVPQSLPEPTAPRLSVEKTYSDVFICELVNLGRVQ
jgi:hypothetical protein